MTISLGYRALDVGRARAHALIDQLSAQEPVDWLCAIFDVRVRVTTPIASDVELRALSDFGYAVESTNYLRRVEALPAAAASCR